MANPLEICGCRPFLTLRPSGIKSLIDNYIPKPPGFHFPTSTPFSLHSVCRVYDAGYQEKLENLRKEISNLKETHFYYGGIGDDVIYGSYK